MPTWNFLVGLGIVDRGTGKFLKDTRTELDGTKKSFQGLGDTADGVADRTAQGARKMADAVHKSSRDIGRSWRDAGKSSREGMGGGRGGGRGGRGGDKYGFLGFDVKDIGDKLKGLGSAGGSIFTGLAGDFGDMIDKNVEWSSSFKETAGISEKSVSRMAGSIITQMRRTGISIREASGAWEDLRENLTSDEAVREMKRAVGLKEAFDIPPSTYANWVGTSEVIGMTQRDMTDLLDTSASMTKKMGLPRDFLKQMMELSDTTRDISMTFGLAPEKSMSMVKSMMRATAAMSKVLKGGIDAATRAVENMVKKTADRRKEMEKFRLGLGGDIDNVMDQVTELSRGVGDADFAFSLLMDQDTSNVIKRLQGFYKTIEGDKQAVERFRFTVEDAFGEDVANSVVRLGDKMQKEMGNAAKSQTANFGEMGKSIEDVMATATRAENKARMAEQIKLFQEGSLFVGRYVEQLNKYAEAQDKIARKTTGWAASHKKIMEWISKYVVGKHMMEFAGGRRGGGWAGLIPTLGIPGAIIYGLMSGVGGMGRGVGLFGGVAGKLGGIQPLGWLKGLLGMGKGAGAGARGLGAGVKGAGLAAEGIDASGGIMGMTKASLGIGRAGAGAGRAAGVGRAGLGAARAVGGFTRFLGVLGKVSGVLTAIVGAVDLLYRGIPRFIGIWKEGGTIWEKGWKSGVAYADTVSQVLNDLTFGLYKYIDIWGYIRRFLGDDFLLNYLPKFFSDVMGQAVSLLKTVVSIGARIVKFGWDVNVARPLKVVWTILKGVAGAVIWVAKGFWNLSQTVRKFEVSLGMAFGKLVKVIGGGIIALVKGAIGQIKSIWTSILSIPKFFADIVKRVTKIFSIVAGIGKAFIMLSRPVRGIWNMFQGIATMMRGIEERIWGIGEAVGGWEMSAAKALGGFAKVLMGGLYDPIVDIVKKSIEKVKDIIRVPLQWIKQHLSWITDIWNAAFGPIKDYIEAVKAFIDLRKGEMTTETGVGGEGTWGKGGWGDVLKGKYGAAPEKWQGMMTGAASRAGVTKEDLETIFGDESAWQEGAISPAGARGVAQLMPKTAAGHGLVPHEKWGYTLAPEAMKAKMEKAMAPWKGWMKLKQTTPKMIEEKRAGFEKQIAIQSQMDAGAQEYAWRLKRYGGDKALALADYNWGYVDKWLKGKAGPIPNETLSYVQSKTGITLPQSGLDYPISAEVGKTVGRKTNLMTGYGEAGMGGGEETMITAPTYAEDYEGDITTGGLPEGLAPMPAVPALSGPDINYGGGGGGGFIEKAGGKVEGVLGSIVDALRRLKGDVFMDGKKIGEVVWGNIREKVEAEIREGVSTRG